MLGMTKTCNGNTPKEMLCISIIGGVDFNMKQYTYKTIAVSSLLAFALMVPLSVEASSVDGHTAAITELDNKREEIPEKRHSRHQKDITKEQWQAMRLKKLQKLATYFNISTDGKTSEQIRLEIEKAKKDNPEKWEAFKQQYRAKKLEKLREYAEENGISIEGKTEQQILEELHKLKGSK